MAHQTARKRLALPWLHQELMFGRSSSILLPSPSPLPLLFAPPSRSGGSNPKLQGSLIACPLMGQLFCPFKRPQLVAAAMVRACESSHSVTHSKCFRYSYRGVRGLSRSPPRHGGGTLTTRRACWRQQRLWRACEDDRGRGEDREDYPTMFVLQCSIRIDRAQVSCSYPHCCAFRSQAPSRGTEDPSFTS